MRCKDRIKAAAFGGFAVVASAILFTGCITGRWIGGKGKALALDPGGFSVDFSESWQHLPTQGDNLVKNGGFEEAAAAAGRPRDWDTEQTTSRENAAEGRHCLKLAIPPVVSEKPGDAKPVLAANCFQDITLPPLNNEATYVLSYQFRGATGAGPQRGQAHVSATLYGSGEKPGTGKILKKPDKQKVFPLTAWNRGVLFIGVSANAVSLRVAFQLEGSGSLYLDDVSVRAKLVEGGLSPYLVPGTFLDNLFCLASGDPAIMGFQFQNELPGKTYQPDLILRVPVGVKVMDCENPDRIVEAKPVTSENLMEYRLRVQWQPKRFNRWIPFLVSTSLPAGDKTYPCSYWIEDGTYRSAVKEFSLKVIPAMETVVMPKTFKTGAFLWLHRGTTKPESVLFFTAFYKRLGFNAVHVQDAPLLAEMGRVGIERYTERGDFCNGYSLGSAKKPDDALFRAVDGKPLDGYSICPVEVYTRGPYFKSAIENDIIRKLIVTDRLIEQVMTNWEPGMYVKKGCFCDRCKEEFRTFSKLSQAEFDGAWPQDILTKYGETWTRFRAWQHGKMVVTLEETVNTAGREVGLDSHFIPAIHYGELHFAHEKLDKGLHNEFSPVEYMDKLPILEPWGPYVRCFFPQKPYDYICGVHLSAAANARETLEFLASRLPQGKRPRLIAFPHCSMICCNSQPEATWFEILTYFVSGYYGAFAYPFYTGSDARYWNALAAANRQIARFEPFVFQGKVVMKHDLKPETSLPKSDPRWLSEFGPIDSRWRELPMLQSWEFEKEEKRLIAVGNFWERGEVFFRVTPKELKDGTAYVLWEPDAGRCYADSAGKVALSATELAQGVLLHAGALRYSFFVLEPWQKGVDYGTVVRPQDMEATMQARLGAIQEAYSQDDVPRASVKAVTVDYSNLKTVTKTGMECKPVTWPGISTPCLSFQSSAQTLVLDPGNGGRVVSWKVADFELVHREDPYGLLLESFLYPNLIVTQPYSVVTQEETSEGIRITLEKTLSTEAGALTGLTLRKTIEVPVKGSGFRAVTVITNAFGAGEVEFAYRSHNMPAFLEQREGRKGWARMDNGGTPVVFDRQGGQQRIFRRAGAPDMALDVVPVAPGDTIGGNVIDFGSDRSPLQLRVNLKGDLYSIYYCDLPAMPCATFEPVFSRTTLKRGETWTVEMDWQVTPLTEIRVFKSGETIPKTKAVSSLALGMNMFAIDDTSAFDSYVDDLLANGITNMRIGRNYYEPTEARSKAAAIRMAAKGVKVTWLVSSNNIPWGGISNAAHTITQGTWPAFRAAILADAAWAQANGIYEFQIGNEEELHLWRYPIAMTRTGGNLVTVTFAEPHGFNAAHGVKIWGAPDTWNAYPASITVTGPNTFTYVEAGDNRLLTAGELAGVHCGDVDEGPLQALLKGVATEVQAIYTRGNVSYTTTGQYFMDKWHNLGRGDIDILAFNAYTNQSGWAASLANQVKWWGADHTYLTEFGLHTTSIDSYSPDEAAQAAGLTSMIATIKAAGITRATFFDYIGNDFGARKDDGTYRKIWDVITTIRSVP